MKTFLKQYRVGILIIAVAVAGAGGFYTTSFLSAQKIIEQNKTRTAEVNTQTKKKIAEIIAAQKAKKLAEAKRKAAAKAATHATTTPTKADSSACNTSTTHNNPASIDVIVNKKHCIQPLNYTPDLTTVHGTLINTEASKAFDAMYSAAAADNEAFSVTSSYRSYADQISTYNYWVSTSGQKGADTYSARPGYSEHQTGLAVDVAAPGCALDCFGKTTQYKWLQAHAAEYGFIQRYYKGYESITGYKAEEWHYRYVGKTVAQDMKKRGIYTLEQYWDISGGDY